MRKVTYILIPLAALLASCSGSAKTDEAEAAFVRQTDSTVQVVDQKVQETEKKNEELQQEIDQILNEI